MRCTEFVEENLKALISVLDSSDSAKVNEVIKNAEDTRTLYDRITEYLAELFASGGLTEEQATQTAGICLSCAAIMMRSWTSEKLWRKMKTDILPKSI